MSAFKGEAVISGSDGAPIMGVDIARQGADQSVIRFRRGLDARSIPAVKSPRPPIFDSRLRIMR
jgi:hypothetical protein